MFGRVESQPNMSSRILAAVIIGGACVAAAGGGAYLAVRQSAQAAPAGVLAGSADPAPPVPTGQAPDITAEPSEPAATSPASPPTSIETPAARRQVAPNALAARSTAAGRRAGETPATPAQALTETAPIEPAPAGSEATPADLAPPAASETPSPYIPSRPTLEDTPAETAAPAAPGRDLEELLIPADAVIGVQIDRTISSDFARVEDRVDGRVTRDVRVAGQVAVPAGSKVRGSVTFAEQGGKFKTRARLGVRFHTILLADGSSIPIQTEIIFREGASPAGDARAKIGGGAVGGAIIGAILGGRKGAAIGGSLGAGAGTAAVAAGDNNPAVLPSGSTVTVRLSRPATVTIEKH